MAGTDPVPPPRTAAQREAALAKAGEARATRAELKQAIHDGTIGLDEVFARAEDDEVVANIKVLTLLEAIPYVGKIRSRRMLEDLGISERRRVRGVGSRQRVRLLERIAERAAGPGADRG